MLPLKQGTAQDSALPKLFFEEDAIIGSGKKGSKQNSDKKAKLKTVT